MKTKTWKVNDKRYTCYISDLGYDCQQRKNRIGYTFKCGREIIFQDNDLFCSPLHDPESTETILSLMTFLTLRKGDTDSEYFDNYTPRQLAFSESFDCELLSYLCMEAEERLNKIR